MTDLAVTTAPQEEAQSQKEYNFAQLRKVAEQERAERMRLEQEIAQLKASKAPSTDDDDDDEPYVDKRKLNKKLNQFGQDFGQKTADIVRNEVQKAIYEERKQNWFKNNPDFQKVMTPDILNKFEQQAPELASSILAVPDEFERQKLAYANIKALRIDQPTPKEVPVQDQINRNKQHPGYQPSNISNSPYQVVGDFSATGQKSNYEKMQALKKNMRF
jgi:hypothetical protein